MERDGPNSSLDGAGLGEGGAGGATGVVTDGPGISRTRGVGGSVSGRTRDGGATPTVSDKYRGMDSDNDLGAEDCSDENFPGERDHAKRGRAPA